MNKSDRKHQIKQSLTLLAKADPNFSMTAQRDIKRSLIEDIRSGQTVLILAIMTFAIGAYPLSHFSAVREILFTVGAAAALLGAWKIDRARILAKRRRSEFDRK